MNLSKFILRAELQNTNEINRDGDSSYNTKDLVYITSYNEIENLEPYDRVCSATDYAVMNGGQLSEVDKELYCWCYLRSADTFGQEVSSTNFGGDVDPIDVNLPNGSIRPSVRLDISAVVSEMKSSPKFLNIKEFKNSNDNYHTLEFGEFPKTYVGNKLNKELEKKYSCGALSPTGKTYMGGRDFEITEFGNHVEYTSNGRKYVRVSVITYYNEESVYRLVEKNFGILKKIYDLTIKGFNQSSCEKFVKRMFVETTAFSPFLPKRTLEELKNELISLKTYKGDENFSFDLVYISEYDKIITPKNQLNFWNKRNEKIIIIKEII